MFSVSEENNVKCLEGPSDIFGSGRTSSLVFGNLQQYSGIVDSRRKSSQIIRNCLKMAENSLILALLEPFLLLSGKNLLLPRFFLLLALNCLKFVCFMLQSQKNEVFSVIDVPLFIPSFNSDKRPVLGIS